MRQQSWDALDEVKNTPTYRYVRELTTIFENARLDDEPIEIPLEAVMRAAMPNYLPFAAAFRVRFFYCHAIYATREESDIDDPDFGALSDAMREVVKGVIHMISLARSERE